MKLPLKIGVFKPRKVPEACPPTIGYPPKATREFVLVGCGIPVMKRAGVPEAVMERFVLVVFKWKAFVEETVPVENILEADNDVPVAAVYAILAAVRVPVVNRLEAERDVPVALP